jgi:hypothetical protein
MANENQQLIAVQSGQVDITLTSAPLAAANTADGYNLLVEKTVDNMGIVMPVIPTGSGTSDLGNPMGNDVTCDVALRKAVAYAIDRDQICDEALGGYGTPAYSENDGMPWWNPECVIETDVEYAVRLLEEAGWADTDGDGIREKNGLKASVPVYYFAGDSAPGRRDERGGPGAGENRRGTAGRRGGRGRYHGDDGRAADGPRVGQRESDHELLSLPLVERGQGRLVQPREFQQPCRGRIPRRGAKREEPGGGDPVLAESAVGRCDRDEYARRMSVYFPRKQGPPVFSPRRAEYGRPDDPRARRVVDAGREFEGLVWES